MRKFYSRLWDAVMRYAERCLNFVKALRECCFEAVVFVVLPCTVQTGLDDVVTLPDDENSAWSSSPVPVILSTALMPMGGL
jgi:hypothetical protein